MSLWFISIFERAALSCLPCRGPRMRTHLGGVVSSPAWVCPSQRPSVALPRLLYVWTSVECSKARPQTSRSTSWGWQGSAQTSCEQSGAFLHSSPCSCPNSPTKLCLGTSTFRWNSHPAQNWQSWKMYFSFFHNHMTVSDTFCFFPRCFNAFLSLLSVPKPSRCWVTSPKVPLDPYLKWKTRPDKRHMLSKSVCYVKTQSSLLLPQLSNLYHLSGYTQSWDFKARSLGAVKRRGYYPGWYAERAFQTHNTKRFMTHSSCNFQCLTYIK